MEIINKMSVVSEAPKYSLMSVRAVPGEGVASTRQQTPSSAFKPCKASPKKVLRTRD